MLVSEQQPKCTAHIEEKALFMEICQDGSFKLECEQCAVINSIRKRRLVSLNGIRHAEKNGFIFNWPPLSSGKSTNSSKMNEQIEILIGEENKAATHQMKLISNSIARVKEKITLSLDQVQKELIQTVRDSQTIQNAYNEVSKKEQLKSIIQEWNSQNEKKLTRIVKEVIDSTEANSLRIQEALTVKESSPKISFDETALESFLDFASQSIKNIMRNQNMPSTPKNQPANPTKNQQKSPDQAAKMLEKQHSQWLENVKSSHTSQLLTDQQVDISEEVKDSLIQMQEKVKALVHSDRESLTDRIKEALVTKKTRHSKSIEQVKTCFRNIDGNDTYNIGYIEAVINSTKSKQSFQIRAKNLVNWIGIGVVEKEALSTSQANNDSQESISGYYMLSHNGYIWSSKNKGQSNMKDSFLFRTDDIITITLEGNLLIFEKQNSKLTYELPAELHPLYPGFILFSPGDEVEFITL